MKWHLTSLTKLNAELAGIEAKQKAEAMATAGGLGVGGAVLVFYAIGFGLAAAAAGLAEALPVWLSLLIVMAVLLIVAAILVILAKRSAGRASPVQPTQAIEEAQRTVRALQGNA